MPVAAWDTGYPYPQLRPAKSGLVGPGFLWRLTHQFWYELVWEVPVTAYYLALHKPVGVRSVWHSFQIEISLQTSELVVRGRRRQRLGPEQQLRGLPVVVTLDILWVPGMLREDCA